MKEVFKLYVTEHFQLSELCNNREEGFVMPEDSVLKNIRELCENLLEPLREELNDTINITSGFRTKSHNETVNGSNKSQHLKGQAVDIHCSDNEFLRSCIARYFDFDQMICYLSQDGHINFIHVSYVRGRCRGLQLFSKGDYLARHRPE